MEAARRPRSNCGTRPRPLLLSSLLLLSLVVAVVVVVVVAVVAVVVAVVAVVVVVVVVAVVAAAAVVVVAVVVGRRQPAGQQEAWPAHAQEPRRAREGLFIGTCCLGGAYFRGPLINKLTYVPNYVHRRTAHPNSQGPYMLKNSGARGSHPLWDGVGTDGLFTAGPQIHTFCHSLLSVPTCCQSVPCFVTCCTHFTRICQ